MTLIKIKPLYVNEAFKGRRFKSDKYKSYERFLLQYLKKIDNASFVGKLEIHFKFGFSSKLSDLDNPVKPLLDILCKHYGFDDRQVYKIVLEKEIVKKGNEYLEFIIK